jgi:hypothetical protein
MCGAVMYISDEVKAVLWKHYDELRNIFAFYGSQSGPISLIGHISSLTFIHFCHTCRIPDKNLTGNFA